MNGWPSKPFREIFKLKQGKYLTKDEMVDAPQGDWTVPVYGANGIIGYTNRFMYDRPVPLVSCRGANCGVTHLTQPKSWISNNSIACVSDQADPRFFFHVFRITSFADVTGGSAQPQITLSSLGPKQIVCPPLETQRRIASILGAYDDLIEINRRRIAVLEEMARGLFEEWFVRFRFPGHETVPILDTPDGPLPEGWSFAPLDSFVVLQRGFDLPKSSRVDGDIPVFSASGFHGGHNEHKVNGPGLVTGRSGTIGQVHLVMEDFWPLNTTLYVREFRRAGPAYGLFLLRYMELAKHSGGAAVPTLNRNHIHNIKLPAAPQSLIDRFELFAFANLKLCRVIELQNERLASSRDLLLPRLISGQLSVAEAEHQLQEVA